MNNLQTYPQEYLEDVLIRLAYNSAGIEGNRMSLSGTVSIIVNRYLPVNDAVTVREFYEIENHKQAFETILADLLNGQPLTVTTVQRIHADLMDRLQYDCGQFKKSENAILGAAFTTASASATPLLMQELVEELVDRLDTAESDDEKLLAILDSHIKFERIHPFSDGNGRTGRLLLNYSLLEQGFPPLIIQKETKETYFEILAKQDLTGFFEYAKALLEDEPYRLQAFKNMAAEQIQYE